MSSPRAVLPLQRPPDVVVDIPGSKSHTNRALICAALGDGRSQLGRVLFADDTEAMLGALGALGVQLSIDTERATVSVNGGLNPVGDRPIEVDARQSGTTSRFLLPLLAATPGRFVLDGH
ncbi:MAG: 3-phosphoshikimate 1-carboxyvinyltransferase, partial [Actinomycetota bacterium]